MKNELFLICLFIAVPTATSVVAYSTGRKVGYHVGYMEALDKRLDDAKGKVIQTAPQTGTIRRFKCPQCEELRHRVPTIHLQPPHHIAPLDDQPDA